MSETRIPRYRLQTYTSWRFARALTRPTASVHYCGARGLSHHCSHEALSVEYRQRAGEAHVIFSGRYNAETLEAKALACLQHHVFQIRSFLEAKTRLLKSDAARPVAANIIAKAVRDPAAWALPLRVRSIEKWTWPRMQVFDRRVRRTLRVQTV